MLFMGSYIILYRKYMQSDVCQLLLSALALLPMTNNRYEMGRLSRFYARCYPPRVVLWVRVTPCPFVHFISHCAEESPCPCSAVWGCIRYTLSDKIS